MEKEEVEKNRFIKEIETLGFGTEMKSEAEKEE